MSHTDYRTLIARGRKAGLTTNELYAALSARPPEGGDEQPGQSDSNGYVTDFNGNTVKVKATPRLRVTKTVRASLKSLRPGDSVVVQGTKQKDGSYKASSIALGSPGGRG